MVEVNQATGPIVDTGLVTITITNRRLGRPITRSRIENALRIMAEIIAEGEHKYLPIFLRLESELASCDETEVAIERALIISRQ